MLQKQSFNKVKNKLKSRKSEYPSYAEIRLTDQLNELLDQVNPGKLSLIFYSALKNIPFFGGSLYFNYKKKQKNVVLSHVASFRAFTVHYIMNRLNNNFYLLEESEIIDGVLPLKKELSRLHETCMTHFNRKKDQSYSHYILQLINYGIELLTHIQNETELFDDYVEMTLIQKAKEQNDMEAEGEMDVDRTVVLFKKKA